MPFSLDQLFPSAPGFSGLVTLTADTVFTAAMRGKLIKLSGHKLTLAAIAAGKHGAFFVLGAGFVDGALVAELTANQALTVAVNGAEFDWMQASVQSVAGKTGDVELVIADIGGLAAALADKASGPLAYDTTVNITNIHEIPTVDLPEGALRIVRMDMGGSMPFFYFAQLSSGAIPSWTVGWATPDDFATSGKRWLFLPFGPKNNNNAAVAPTIANDSTYGFAPGSLWCDTVSDLCYVCLDASTGNAIWRQIGVIKTLALADGALIAWNFRNGNVATVTLTGNRTLSNPTNVTAGTYLLRVKQDGAGSRTLAYGNSFRFMSGIAPVLSTEPGAVDILTIINFGDADNYIVAAKKFLAP